MFPSLASVQLPARVRIDPCSVGLSARVAQAARSSDRRRLAAGGRSSWARRPRSSAKAGSVRQRRTKASSSAWSRTTTAASCVQEQRRRRRENSRCWGRTRRRRRRRRARSCSGRRGWSGCRRRRRFVPCPTSGPARRRHRRGGCAGDRGLRSVGTRAELASGVARRRRGGRAARRLRRTARDGGGRGSAAAAETRATVARRRDSASDSSGSCVLPARKTTSSGVDAGEAGQSLRLGGVAIGASAVEFDRAGDVNRCSDRRPSARNRSAYSSFCTAIRSIWPSTGRTSQANPPVAAKALLAEPAVDDGDLRAVLLGRGDQVRPQLQLGQHEQRRAGCGASPAARPR